MDVPGHRSLGRGPIASRYDLLRVIDRGGYAVVYEAEDRRLHRTVAIKMVLPDHPDPAAAARLTREAHVMASITHPNVCGVSDVGTLEDGRPFFIMDRLQGETLRSLLNRELVVDVELAIGMMLELLSALHAVHAGGVVHRDLKPENIFLAERNSCQPAVKLLDFGCCGPMTAGDEEEGDSLTRDWHVVGTAAYMAPEQAAGSRMFHAGIDVFAAALVLLEMLTGFRPPARGGKIEAIPALSTFRDGLPTALDAILGRALSSDPRQRYRSTVAFAKDLVEVQALSRKPGAPASSVSNQGSAPRLPVRPGAYSEEGPAVRQPPLPLMRARAASYSEEGPSPRQPAIPPMRARAASYADEGPASRQPAIPPMRARAPTLSEDDTSPRQQPVIPPVRARTPSQPDDPTRDDYRRSVTLKRAARDTLREHDDEDTPQDPQRPVLPRTIISSS